MEDELRIKIISLGLFYIPVEPKSLEKVYRLFCRGELDWSPETGYEHLCYGVYFACIKIDPDQMKYHYLEAIKLGYMMGCNNLAVYYRDIEFNNELMNYYLQLGMDHDEDNCFTLKGIYHHYTDLNYDLMKKCYLRAIELGSVTAAANLAIYYREVEINEPLMLEYFQLAIDRGGPNYHLIYSDGNSTSLRCLGQYFSGKDNQKARMYYKTATKTGNSLAMVYLAYHYQTIEMNNEKMKKYYLMAIEQGNSMAMNNLGHYYLNQERNHELCVKYYLMAIEKKHTMSMFNLGIYYQKNAYDKILLRKYYTMAIEAGKTQAIDCLAQDYQMETCPNQDAFEFGLTYQRSGLIEQHYQPEHVHSLLRVRVKHLPLNLRKIRSSHVNDLLNTLRAESTWFHPWCCVKDVLGIIQDYLNG